MKNLKKILIALAVVALLVSAVVLTVTAEEYTGDIGTLQGRFDTAKQGKDLQDKSQKLNMAYSYYMKEKPIDPATEGFAELVAEIDAFAVQLGVEGRAQANAQATYEEKIAGYGKVYDHFVLCPAPNTTPGYEELIAGLESDYVEAIKGWIAQTNAMQNGFEKREEIVKIYTNLAAKPIDRVANEESLTTLKNASMDAALALYDEYEAIPAEATAACPYPNIQRWNAVGQLEYFFKSATDITSHSGYSALNTKFIAAKAAVTEALAEAQEYLDSFADFDSYYWTDGMKLYTFDDSQKLTFYNATSDCYAEVRMDENGNKYQAMVYGEKAAHLYTEPTQKDKSKGWVLDYDIKVSSTLAHHGYGAHQSGFNPDALFVIRSALSNGVYLRNGNIIIANSTGNKEEVDGVMVPNVWTHITVTYDDVTKTGAVYVNYEKIFDLEYSKEHKFEGFRMQSTSVANQLVCYDNFFCYPGNQYRDVNKFTKMSDAEEFVYYVNFFSSPANADRALSRNKAYIKAKALYATYLTNNETLNGADRLTDENGQPILLSDYVKIFTDCKYDEEIKKPAQETNLATLTELVTELCSLPLNSSRISVVEAAIAEVNTFISENGELLNKADKNYLEQIKHVKKIEKDIAAIRNAMALVDALAKFARATSYNSMNKHYETAKSVFEKGGFDVFENEEFVRNDPYVKSFETDYNGFEVTAETNPDDFVSVFEYYLTLEGLVADRKAVESAQKVVECYGFIVALENYEATVEFWAANYDYIETYVSVARSIINNGAYYAGYEGVSEAVDAFVELDTYFYVELQKEHIANIKAQLANYLATDSYITKAGICEYLTQYVQDKDNDVAVFNENLSERVLLAAEDEIKELNELLVILDVYRRELLLQADDYAAVLEENTKLFIGAVNRMSAYFTYADIKPIFEEARTYYYGMNVDSEEAQAAIEAYNEYAEIIEDIEICSEMFKGHVARFAEIEEIGIYDIGEIYKILCDCVVYSYSADVTIDGVAEAAEIFEKYLNDYVEFANAVNSGVADAFSFVISARTDMIITTVLAAIGGIINL